MAGSHLRTGPSLEVPSIFCSAHTTLASLLRRDFRPLKIRLGLNPMASILRESAAWHAQLCIGRFRYPPIFSSHSFW